MTETKLEPLPWFAFNVAEYIKDTMRLTTEGHGSYLLLILDYYATGEPCPDDDDILAAVAKLPIEVWKAKHRKVLAPFFEIAGGVWRHNRIEREMLEAQLKHSSSIARAKLGGHARWAKQVSKPAKPARTSRKQGQLLQKDAPSTAQAVPAAQPEQCLGDAHLHLHKTLSLQVDDLVEEGVAETDLGAPINPSYRPPAAVVEALKADNIGTGAVEIELAKFVYHHQEQGTWSHDWDGSFGKWMERFKQYRAEQEAKAARAKPRAPPRIVVNGVEPDPSSYDRACKLFAAGGVWARALGPEPGQVNCRVPTEILERHNIDPATGMQKRKEPAA